MAVLDMSSGLESDYPYRDLTLASQLQQTQYNKSSISTHFEWLDNRYFKQNPPKIRLFKFQAKVLQQKGLISKREEQI
jgi:hypothetical protein